MENDLQLGGSYKSSRRISVYICRDKTQAQDVDLLTHRRRYETRIYTEIRRVCVADVRRVCVAGIRRVFVADICLAFVCWRRDADILLVEVSFVTKETNRVVCLSLLEEFNAPSGCCASPGIARVLKTVSKQIYLHQKRPPTETYINEKRPPKETYSLYWSLLSHSE